MHRLIGASMGDARGGAVSPAEAELTTTGRRMACHLDQPDSVLTSQLPIEAIDPDTAAWPPLVHDLEEPLNRRAVQLSAPEPGLAGEGERNVEVADAAGLSARSQP
ncbi:hypothetical protein [Nonomuraea sp. NPDC023979]|uniref:hypothetical protein n=1 Tax=Nonomuraea sp. NPDC023979 TaxID=3154796 RepID=UPI0033C6B92F